MTPTETTDAPAQISSEFAYRPVLDGLRAVAVLTVMVFHAQLIMPGGRWLVKGGFLGVDIFFVLSGFLITSVLLKEKARSGTISLRNFYARRFLRLTPAFWTFLLLLWLLAGYVSSPERAAATYEDHNFLFSFSYLLNWHNIWTGMTAGHLNLTWSLAIEEQFYLIWGISLSIIVARSRRPISWLLKALPLIIALIAIVRVMRAMYGTPTDVLYYSTDMRIDGLLTGCLAAVIYAARPMPAWLSSKLMTTAFFASIVACIAIFFSFSDQDPLFYYGFGTLFNLSVAVVILWLLTRDGTIIHRILEFRPIVWLGSISYGVYLWHYVSYDIASRLTSWRTLNLALGIALGVLIAAGSYYLVELPFLRLKRRFSNA